MITWPAKWQVASESPALVSSYTLYVNGDPFEAEVSGIKSSFLLIFWIESAVIVLFSVIIVSLVFLILVSYFLLMSNTRG